jgi:hypothetical protein
MGETRVDLLHLLEDLRDAYPGGLEETILTEIVANALDSGAAAISLLTAPSATTLTVSDDGSGMARRELARYHDIAATTKTRGEGIGFAGVGIKLGLLVALEVTTETRRGASHVATTWSLVSRHRAPWKWVRPPGLVAARGTAVRLKLREPLSPLLDTGFLAATLRRHFAPLLDASFDEVLARHYPRGVRFVLNGVELVRRGAAGERVPLAVRVGRRRKPSAVGYLLRGTAPLAEDLRGAAVSTLGKVIRRGWDWLGLSPASGDLVTGLIEVPALAECLQLNKADFIRSGPRGKTYLAYRKALQQAVSAQLAAWGDAPEVEQQAARRRKTRPLERDLEAVLVDLADDFPLVAAIVERQFGGQRRLPIGRRPGAAGIEPLRLPGSPVAAGEDLMPEAEPAGAGPEVPPQPEEPGVERQPEPPAALTVPEGPLPDGGRGGGPRRPMRYGLAVQFESRPEDPELGRLVESTVWVNEAHPAYQRAVASRSDGYHVALTVALALARLVVEPAQVHEFVTTFLGRWGERLDGGRKRGRKARR